jgi:hypothetical protein
MILNSFAKLLAGLRRDITLNFAHDIFIEPDYKPAPFRFFASARAKIIDVIPAILMKHIVDNRRSQQEPYLVARHTDFHTLDILGLQFVALLDIELVYAGA